MELLIQEFQQGVSHKVKLPGLSGAVWMPTGCSMQAMITYPDGFLRVVAE